MSARHSVTCDHVDAATRNAQTQLGIAFDGQLTLNGAAHELATSVMNSNRPLVQLAALIVAAGDRKQDEFVANVARYILREKAEL